MLPIAVSVPKAASLMGIGRTTAFRLIRDGSLATVKIGRRTLIPMTSIESFIEAALSPPR